MKSSKLTVVTIIIATIGLVAAPLAWKGLRTEIAHWYLAAGANAVEFGTGNADREIEQARSWYGKVAELPDYWLLKIKQAKADSPAAMLTLVENAPEIERPELAIRAANELISLREYASAAQAYKLAFGKAVLNNEDYWTLLVMDAYQTSPPAVVQVLREAVEQNSRFSDLALQFSTALASKLEFDSALEALRLAVAESSKDPIVLNQLAYYRALARVDLDQALEDITKALEANENEPALRDTRAWILYQLDRAEEALSDATFAIETVERVSPTGILERWLGEFTTAPDYSSLLPDAKLSDPAGKTKARTTIKRAAGADNEYLTMSSANPFLWNLGVLHYHRAKILEKLHRTEEAQRDWEWIKQRNFPPDDRLH